MGVTFDDRPSWERETLLRFSSISDVLRRVLSYVHFVRDVERSCFKSYDKEQTTFHITFTAIYVHEDTNTQMISVTRYLPNFELRFLDSLNLASTSNLPFCFTFDTFVAMSRRFLQPVTFGFSHHYNAYNFFERDPFT